MEEQNVCEDPNLGWPNLQYDADSLYEQVSGMSATSLLALMIVSWPYIGYLYCTWQ